MRPNYLLIILTFVLLLAGVLIFSEPAFAIFLTVIAIFIFFLVTRFVQSLNNQTIKQFSLMNLQLKVGLNVPTKKPWSLDWLYPSLIGFFLDKHLSISMYTKQQNGFKSPYTSITIDAFHYGKTFKITTEGFYTKVDKLFGKDDILTRDKTFDRLFYVESNDPKFMVKLLDEEIRDIMKHDVFMSMGTFVLNQSQLRYDEQLVINTDKKRKRFEKIILVMYMMTKKMEMMRKKRR